MKRPLIAVGWSARTSWQLRGAAHALFTHAPVAQVIPHAPQLFASARVSVSQPLAGFMSQSAKPASHIATAHAPIRQAGVAWASVHARPHAPQWATAAVTSVSQPLAGVASQSPRPVAQPATRHAPVTHAAVALSSMHARSHMPQCVVDVAVSTHRPPHSDCPSGQRQAPDSQRAPVAQRMSHAPQWSASVAVVTHAPLHAVCDAGHWSWHRPAAHTSPRAQALSHTPQWAGSDAVVTHAPPQTVWAPGHTTTQRPSRHALPAGQELPHVPQWAGSAFVSTQRSSHTTRPEGHVSPASVGGGASAVSIGGDTSATSGGVEASTRSGGADVSLVTSITKASMTLASPDEPSTGLSLGTTTSLPPTTGFEPLHAFTVSIAAVSAPKILSRMKRLSHGSRAVE
jgi:hypothetical protein